jgi:hypothetical protein
VKNTLETSGEVEVNPAVASVLTDWVVSIELVFFKGAARFGSVQFNKNDIGKNYTRNEWRRCKITLKASGEDVKLHSKRVEKMSKQIEKTHKFYAQRGESVQANTLQITTLETSVFLGKLHSKRVSFWENYTRNERVSRNFTLETSVVFIMYVNLLLGLFFSTNLELPDSQWTA